MSGATITTVCFGMVLGTGSIGAGDPDGIHTASGSQTDLRNPTFRSVGKRIVSSLSSPWSNLYVTACLPNQNIILAYKIYHVKFVLLVKPCTICSEYNLFQATFLCGNQIIASNEPAWLYIGGFKVTSSICHLLFSNPPVE